MKDITFKNLMKEYREKSGLSREKFGAKIGTSPFTLRDWETGKSEPHNLVKISALQRAKVVSDAMNPFPDISENGTGSNGIDKLLTDGRQGISKQIDFSIVEDVVRRNLPVHIQNAILDEIEEKAGL